MSKILVITGSTRPNRKSLAVAEWFVKTAPKDKGLEFEIADLAEINLPMFDEPMPPMMGQYQNEHTKKWAAKVGPADGYVLITAEYNHGYSASLKNALDYLYAEWRHKPVGFVSYGVASGVRAVEQLKQIVVQLDMAAINTQVALNLFTAWDKDGAFNPSEQNVQQVADLAGELSWWSDTLKAGREKRKAA